MMKSTFAKVRHNKKWVDEKEELAQCKEHEREMQFLKEKQQGKDMNHTKAADNA